MDELVKYDNKMNEIAIGKLTAREQDLFLAICVKARDSDTNDVTISFSELRELSGYSSRNNELLVSDLKDAYQALIGIDISLEADGVFVGFTLFQKYKVDTNNKELTVSVSEAFRYILNNWELGNFTTFELREFVSLRSKYSRDLYRLLMQYKTTGFYVVRVEDFKELLNTPRSYSMFQLETRIIQPAIDELREHFPRLRYKKIPGKNKRQIARFEFTFQKSPRANSIEAEVSEVERITLEDEDLIRQIEAARRK